MNVSIKQRIIGLAIIAAVLPIAGVVIASLISKSDVSQKTKTELDSLKIQNVDQVAESVYELINFWHMSTKGEISDSVKNLKKELLKKELENISIGKTGYVFVLGAQGEKKG